MIIPLFAIALLHDALLVPDALFEKPTGAGFIVDPRDMTADVDGNIYLLDVGQKAVHYWNAAGAYLGRFGAEGVGPGELNLKSGVGSLTCFEDRIFVFDEDVAKLHIWDRRTRKYLESVAMPEGLRRLPAFGAVDGHLVVINATLSRRDLVVMSPDFKNYRTLATTESSVYVRSDQGWNFYPYANIPLVAFGKKHIYLAETNHNWIKKMDVDGAVVAQFHADIPPQDLSAEEREYTRSKSKWLTENDRIFFPKKRHVFLQIAALDGGRILLLTDYDDMKGIVKGVVMDEVQGTISGKVDMVLEGQIGFFGVAGTDLFIVGSDENDDYQLRRYRLQLGAAAP